jgi:hypothetical protein
MTRLGDIVERDNFVTARLSSCKCGIPMGTQFCSILHILEPSRTDGMWFVGATRT